MRPAAFRRAPIGPAEWSLPKQLELLNGWFYTDGGSVVLEVRDETGAQYRIGLGLSHGRRTGGWRLIFRDWQIAFTSAEHIAILHLLKNASVAPSPEPPVRVQTGEMGTQNPTIIGDDLKKLLPLSAFRFPLSVFRFTVPSLRGRSDCYYQRRLDR